MSALDDLLRVLPLHERERLLRASRMQKVLLDLYAVAHKDIVAYFRTLIQQVRTPTQLLEAHRLSALTSFIESRVALINQGVALAMSSSSANIADLVATQVARESRALGLTPPPMTGPDPALLESTIEPAVNNIGSWNAKLRPQIIRTLREGIIKGETFAQLASRVSAVTAHQGQTTPIARARSHMLANTRYAVVRAANAGREDSYAKVADENGIEIHKMWHATIESCCVSCALMHGRVAPLNEDFEWRGAGLTIVPWKGKLPHPPLHPNCRCRIIPITSDIHIDAHELARERMVRVARLRSVA